MLDIVSSYNDSIKSLLGWYMGFGRAWGQRMAFGCDGDLSFTCASRQSGLSRSCRIVGSFSAFVLLYK